MLLNSQRNILCPRRHIARLEILALPSKASSLLITYLILTKKQYCTQWGYLQTGSGVPKDILPLISRLNTLEWASIICAEAFNITTPPNVNAINKYGGFGISYPRLAFVDGQIDPWRPATPHASPFNLAVHNRTSTVSEPFIMIADAVHHWDENGLFPNETVNFGPDMLPPIPVRETQFQEIMFLKAWMLEWDVHRLMKNQGARALI